MRNVPSSTDPVTGTATGTGPGTDGGTDPAPSPDLSPTLSSALSKAQARDVADRLERPIVLVGMMGAGKSTVGRKLAQQLSLPFVDADDEIVEAAQMPIAEIFDTFGETYFRDGERRVIARLLDQHHGVIATGGGAFVQPATRTLILERAIAVWLDSDLDTLVERVSRKSTRPLLREGDPREILSRLLEERRPAYAQAPIRVTSDKGPHAQAVSRIMEALEQWQQ